MLFYFLVLSVGSLIHGLDVPNGLHGGFILIMGLTVFNGHLIGALAHSACGEKAEQNADEADEAGEVVKVSVEVFSYLGDEIVKHCIFPVSRFGDCRG